MRLRSLPGRLANGYEVPDALDVVRVRPVDILHRTCRSSGMSKLWPQARAVCRSSLRSELNMSLHPKRCMEVMDASATPKTS